MNQSEIQENLLAFDLSHSAFVLCGREQANISKLSDGNLHFFDSSIWIISYVHIDRDFLAVMVQFFVQGSF